MPVFVPVIPALRKQRQKDLEFKTNLSYIVSPISKIQELRT
jgi:hypothetical protein